MVLICEVGMINGRMAMEARELLSTTFDPMFFWAGDLSTGSCQGRSDYIHKCRLGDQGEARYGCFL